MSSDEHRVTRNVYVTVLSKDEKSPLAPESDEEKPKTEKKPDQDKDKTKDQPKETGTSQPQDSRKSADHAAADKSKDDKDKKEEPVVVKIDLDGIQQRILALPIGEELSQCTAGQVGTSVPFRRPHGHHRT
jgi:tricorn protease